MMPLNLKTKPSFSYKLNNDEISFFEQYHDRFTYNGEIVNEIIDDNELELTKDERDNLDTFVYLSRRQIREKRMREKGYEKITINTMRTFATAKKIEVLMESILGDSKRILKIVNGEYAMPLRNRTRGYSLMSLHGSWAKVIE